MPAQTKLWIAAMLVGTAVAIVMLVVQLRGGPAASEALESTVEVGTASAPDRSAPADRGRVEARARADAVRTQLRSSLGAAASASARPSAGGSAPSTSQPSGSATEAGAGRLRDRLGLPPAMLEALHAEFMRLASECIDAARERLPDLEGMVGLALEVASDPELGAVVDEVEISAERSTDSGDEELHTCLRETALSMLLPEPEAGGRFELLITLPLGEPEP